VCILLLVLINNFPLHSINKVYGGSSGGFGGGFMPVPASMPGPAGLPSPGIVFDSPPQHFSPIAGGVGPAANVPASPRVYFPETWLWQMVGTALVSLFTLVLSLHQHGQPTGNTFTFLLFKKSHNFSLGFPYNYLDVIFHRLFSRYYRRNLEQL